MSRSEVDILVGEIDARRPVVMVTVAGASERWQGLVGAHLIVRPGEDSQPAGSHPLVDDAELAMEVERRIGELLARGAGRPELVRIESGPDWLELFLDPLLPPRHLIICGAGHIAVPLAAMARICEYDVTVIDDRAQYANRERFPGATRIVVSDFREGLHRLREATPFDRRTSLVLVTRGHQHDIECLLEVIDDDLAYVGMIGSQRRIRAVFELLETEKQICSSRFDGIHAPIGLDIKAQTPAEIAAAILAEMINVTRGGSARSLSETLRLERVARRENARERG